MLYINIMLLNFMKKKNKPKNNAKWKTFYPSLLFSKGSAIFISKYNIKFR